MYFSFECDLKAAAIMFAVAAVIFGLDQLVNRQDGPVVVTVIGQIFVGVISTLVSLAILPESSSSATPQNQQTEPFAINADQAVNANISDTNQSGIESEETQSFQIVLRRRILNKLRARVGRSSDAINSSENQKTSPDKDGSDPTSTAHSSSNDDQDEEFKELFKEIPKEECPVCYLPMSIDTEQIYQACCGKLLCIGCTFGIRERAREEQDPNLNICPFCRTPPARSNQEVVEMLKKRMECGDDHAFYIMGDMYDEGTRGMPLDQTKAHKMYLRAGELGYSAGYFNASVNFEFGEGVTADKRKAKKYYELAAKGGDAEARYNLGAMEEETGNTNKAIKHFIIAARAGCKDSLEPIKKYFMSGDVSKDEYEKTLRAYQKSSDDVKSEMRSKTKELKTVVINGMNYYFSKETFEGYLNSQLLIGVVIVEYECFYELAGTDCNYAEGVEFPSKYDDTPFGGNPKIRVRYSG